MRCVGDNRRTWISESGKPLRLSVYINRRDSFICQFIILTTFYSLSLPNDVLGDLFVSRMRFPSTSSVDAGL